MPDAEPAANFDDKIAELTRRYRGATIDGLLAVLCPLLVPIHTLDREIIKLPGQSHYRASFIVEIDSTNRSVLRRGCTGKFIPSYYLSGGVWREIAKGRIIDVNELKGLAYGEIYTGRSRAFLETALQELQPSDLLEIDQYGVAAKVLSGLAEYSLVMIANAAGYTVYRMPEDMAKHLGSYPNYDFEFEKDGRRQKVEVKNLWGTNTRYARLIHSKTTRPREEPETWTEAQRRGYYPTSSCKFETQHIFAVSLFLRTGDIQDFAFARSVPKDVRPYGLPRASSHPEHVHQNPACEIGDGTWYATIDEVWELE